MKRAISLLLAVMLLLLCGCGPGENEFQVRFLPCAYDTQASYPQIAVIHNEKELLNHLKQSNSTQLERYDADFFQNRILFVLTLSTSSSIDSYELERVSDDGTYLTFHIKKTRQDKPEPASWVPPICWWKWTKAGTPILRISRLNLSELRKLGRGAVSSFFLSKLLFSSCKIPMYGL